MTKQRKHLPLPTLQLPVIAAPSLEHLVVTVPAADDVTADEVLREFHRLTRAHATKRERVPGEALAFGDEVTTDTVAYVDGHLLPFSLQLDETSELQALPALPGFNETVVQAKVGEAIRFDLVLPADYPVTSLRGVKAQFAVHVRSAHEVTMPEVTNAGFLERLGLGRTLDETMEAIAERLEDALADELFDEGVNLVLDELVARARPQVTEALIEQDVQHAWMRVEGASLERHGFTEPEQREAFDAWRSDVSVRLDSAHRIQVAMVLHALAREHQLTFSDAQLTEALSQRLAAVGLKDDGQTLEPTQRASLAWHFAMVDFVCSKASIRFA